MAEVLPVQVPEGQSYFPASPLRRSSPSQTSIFIGPPPYSSRKPIYSGSDDHIDSLPSSNSSSSRNSQIDITQPSSFASTTSSSTLTLDTTTTFDTDDGLNLPSYGGAYFDDADDQQSPTSTSVPQSQPETTSTRNEIPSAMPEKVPISEDDTSLKPEPSRHVDYLSHDWVEEDIWSSWRHIVSKRKIYGERSRLENASWRTWAKQKYRLRTVSPETLNWLKDCDVTWLYGPLQTARNYSISEPHTEPTSNLSKNNSFLNKKPILKKRSMSEVMLQKSLSSSSLVKQAAAAVQAQQLRPSLRSRPELGRAQSDFSAVSSRTLSTDTSHSYASSHSTSGLQTPEHGEKKHIRFDDRVEQCIAVDVKDTDEDDDDDEDSWNRDENDSSDSSSDDGLVMMKRSNKRRPLARTNSKSSVAENKIIEKLEPTTLKYRTDSPDVPDVLDAATSHSLGTSFWNRKGNLSPSPSQETLRPSNPSRNFLLPEEDDDGDLSWEPSSAFPVSSSSSFLGGRDGASRVAEQDDGYAVDFLVQDDEGVASGSMMRRTESGMLMPYDEVEDRRDLGLLGRVVDTVNTARDIAHVIWNVGWRT
ncbi:hypothetical protein, variant [Verruconis gallopava]|uniref:Nitrogen regulatory protein areA GATA-like domain-containing protein n=1 Tax=Verruconis gallopava TaxID=253628 RepID=A0A0D2AAZ4_9PEZI|nr:uncharacterized protein PV09_04785 [Verruconis gallopava]XP_016213817.1 hypothetical protein, variant [Verruconis gallopava]KIW03947.1 hypothetical protein PV09_04785 [Verruconis gallopava]KIW03948.1 hypothetical protein, variant [Verruconis gallopava]